MHPRLRYAGRPVYVHGVETQRTSIFATLIRGYRNVLRGAAAVVVGTAVLAAAGIVIVYPLWLFATTQPTGYTVVVLVLSAAACVSVLVRWFVRESSRSDHGIAAPLRVMGGWILRVSGVAGLLLGAYVDVLLFQIGRPIVGFALAIVLAAVLGFLFAGSRAPGSTNAT